MKIRQFFWALAILGSLIGGLEFVMDGLLFSKSAPQQAASAALALCWAALPYIFARAADEIVRLSANADTPATPNSRALPPQPDPGIVHPWSDTPAKAGPPEMEELIGGMPTEALTESGPIIDSDFARRDAVDVRMAKVAALGIALGIVVLVAWRLGM